MKFWWVMLALLIAPAAYAQQKACVVASGCGNTLCVEKGQVLPASNCMAMVGGECYNSVGKCERQSDGACGFTITDALKKCIADANAKVPQANR